jgi:hypothetical protein
VRTSRALALSVAVLAAVAVPARAEPARPPSAELVIAWAPGISLTAVEQASRRSGAAFIDRSPQPPAPPQAPRLVHDGVEHYAALRFEDAWKALDKVVAELEHSGGAGLTTGELSDVFLYRALIRSVQGDASAWDEFVTSATVDPVRALDPVRFAPRVVEQFERARASVASQPRVALAIAAPTGCTAVIDGAPAGLAGEVVAGPHWIQAACPGLPPWGQRIVAVAPRTEVAATPKPWQPPGEDELLIQARTAGAQAFVVVAIAGGVATLRVIGVDGRERSRRTIAVERGVTPLADELAALLAPPPRRPWYQERWALATGGGLAAALLLVPLTILLTRDSGPASVVVRPQVPAGAF